MAKLQARFHSQDFPDEYNGVVYERLGLRSSPCDKLSFAKPKVYDFDNSKSPVNRNLSDDIATDLLENDCSLNKSGSFIVQKIKKIERDYKDVMEEISILLSEWLKLRKKTILTLQKSERKFRLIYRTTTGITFISSTMEFFVRAGLILKDIFHFKLDVGLPLVIVPVLSGISITSSILALSYFRSTLDNISRGVRDEKRQQRDLDNLYRKAKWIDKAVQDLFPFGIDLSLLKDSTLEKLSWRHHVCSAIILTNIKKDKTLLEDQNFLPTVKEFVESPAAQIWLNRMKLRKLLDGVYSKCENLSDKGALFGSEVFLNRAAINVYPVFFPLFVKTERTEKIRFIFSCITAIKTAVDLVGSKDEFQEMRDTASELKKEYVIIRKLNKSLISDYD